jgi:type II secretory pathway component PulJ
MPQSFTLSLLQLALALALSALLGAVIYRAWLTVTGNRAIRRHLARQDATGRTWPVNEAGFPRRRASDKAEDLLAQVQRDVRASRECH